MVTTFLYCVLHLTYSWARSVQGISRGVQGDEGGGGESETEFCWDIAYTGWALNCLVGGHIFL